jgi:hypothetical protein
VALRAALACILCKGTCLTCPPLHREPTYDAEFQHFLRGKEIVLSAGSTPKIQGLTVEQAEAVVRLSCLPAFKDLIAKVQADEVSVLSSVPCETCQ